MKRCAIKRKTPLKRISAKQRGLLSIYGRKRKAFLASRPYCEACFLLGHTQRMRSTEVHHAHGRGKNLNNEATWFAVDSMCHEWIHENPNEARKKGLLK